MPQNIRSADRPSNCVSIMLVSLLQHSPARRNHDHPAAHLHHGQRNAKEREHVRANAEGCYQQYETIDCNATSEQSPSLCIVVEGEGEEHRTATDWIYNRKQRAHHQQNALRDVKHSLALPREAPLTMSSRALPDLLE